MNTWGSISIRDNLYLNSISMYSDLLAFNVNLSAKIQQCKLFNSPFNLASMS